MNKISPEVFESEAFQTQAYYQGCAHEIVIQPDQNGSYDFSELDKLEQSGKYIAEPKGDGNWAAIFKSRSTLNHYSRTCKNKGIPTEFYDRIPDGTLIVGEAMRGSQYSIAMVNHYGHDFFLLWDILYFNYQPVKDLPAKERRKLLETMVNAGNFDGRLKVLPQYTKDFSKEYLLQHEGLVLKPIDEGAYVGNGTKQFYWIKVKKWFETDAIVIGYNRSTVRGDNAGLGCDLPANVLVALYGDFKLNECRKSFDLPFKSPEYFGVKYDDLQIQKSIVKDGKTLNLKIVSAINCGDYKLGQKIVDDYNWVKYKVIKVHHYGQFESGSFRHPNPHGGLEALRDDKRPEDCIFEGVKYKMI